LIQFKASYNKYRAFCGLTKAVDFEDLKDQILDKNIRSALKHEYRSPGAFLFDMLPNGNSL
jgi:hypothetical protein